MNREAKEFLDSLAPEDREKVCILRADMSSYEEMQKLLFREVIEKAGHVDWLVSNVGIKYLREI